MSASTYNISAPAVMSASTTSTIGAATSNLSSLEIETLVAKRHSKGAWKQNRNFVGLYFFAMILMYMVYQTFHDIGLSTLLTLSVFLQCVAHGALLISIVQRQSVAGVSLKCVAMQGASFGLRLCSTTWLKGYIPVDSTGDWLYQLMDFAALLLCGAACLCITRLYRDTYDEPRDTFPAGPTMLGCIVLACFIHPDLNNRPLFDAIWTCSLYTDVFSMLPQVFLMRSSAHDGQCILDAVTVHYVALIGGSRITDMIFWSYGYEELAPEKGGFNLAGYTVLGAHILHVLLLLDFMYLYVRAMWKIGFSSRLSGKMDIGTVEEALVETFLEV